MRKASSAAALATAAFVLTPLGADAGVQVVGSTLAAACSKAAFAKQYSRGELDRCNRSLDEEALLPRDRAATHVNRGVLLMWRRDMDAALVDFERAAAIRPDLGEAYANRGAIRTTQGRYADAVADFDRALELGVDMPERTYFNRAVARELMDDAKGAYLDYRKAAQLNPKWPEPREEMLRFTVIRR